VKLTKIPNGNAVATQARTPPSSKWIDKKTKGLLEEHFASL
jgi:hypothetical protein